MHDRSTSVTGRRRRRHKRARICPGQTVQVTEEYALDEVTWSYPGTGRVAGDAGGTACAVVGRRIVAALTMRDRYPKLTVNGSQTVGNHQATWLIRASSWRSFRSPLNSPGFERGTL